jgi:hypothetical protein
MTESPLDKVLPLQSLTSKTNYLSQM